MTIFSATIKNVLLTGFVACVLLLPMAGLHLQENGAGLGLTTRFSETFVAIALIMAVRFFYDFRIYWPRAVAAGAAGAALLCCVIPFAELPVRIIAALAFASLIYTSGILKCERSFVPASFKAKWSQGGASLITHLLVLIALFLPLLSHADRYVIDTGFMVLTYIALAFSLNMIIGYIGLLDLGFVAYYALGAYSSVMAAQMLPAAFWFCVPIAGVVAALAAAFIGFVVLRLRGDYLAIVTLGFAEILRLLLINEVDFTGGPNGISTTSRPTLLGLEFKAATSEGVTFSDFFGVEYNPVQRTIFMYYLMLGLALAIGWFTSRLRKLPIGRAWEALREDEIACAAIGINRTRMKMIAYILAAFCAGLVGPFFAARQGFISPESFTFLETTMILAVVVLGGKGSHLGIILAALFIIGLPELFRDLEQYRMLAFGAGMVAIMILRPGGIMAERQPAVLYTPAQKG